jgi:TolB-like protein/Flp pilus assembly protein TadD
VVAAAVVVATLGWFGWQQMVTGPGITSVAVLSPQDIVGDTTQRYFALGIHDGIIGELDQVTTLRVISRTSSAAYDATAKPVPEIARELDVDAIVEPSFRRVGDSVHLRVTLVRARPIEENNGTWAYDRQSRDVLRLYGEVARDLARRTRAGGSTRGAAAIRRVNPATYEAYVKAMYYMDKGTPEGVAQGMPILRQAIDNDPGDALAWAGLSVGYITAAHGPAPQVDALPAARAAAERALKLDPTLAETLASLAFVKGYYEYDWQAADSLFRRSLRINPSLAMGHYWYAWQLALFDRMDEAIAEHKRAREVDPLNPLNTAWLGWLYAWQDRLDEAMAEARRSLEMDPKFPVGHLVMAEVYAIRGQKDSAVAAARRAAEPDAEWLWALGRAYAHAGRTAEARRIVAELEAKPATPWNAVSLALVYTALGDRDMAFQWLDYEHPHAWVPWVRSDRLWEPLWDDPRLSALLRKMNLPPRRAAKAPTKVTRRGADSVSSPGVAGTGI